MVEFSNSTSIPPGYTAKVSQVLSAMMELQFTGYRQSDGVTIPFSGGVIKRTSFLRSVAVVTARWWDEVLLRSTSVVSNLRALHATARTRLEFDRRVNHGTEVATRYWQWINAEFVRWRSDVPLPRIVSTRVRVSAAHENVWLRLAEARQKRQHRDQVERQAWEAIDARIMRWWDEVVLPRIRFYRRPN